MPAASSRLFARSLRAREMTTAQSWLPSVTAASSRQKYQLAAP